MSTVQEISPRWTNSRTDELRVVKLGVDARLLRDDDPALQGRVARSDRLCRRSSGRKQINRRGPRAHSKMDFRVGLTSDLWHLTF